MNKKVSKTTKNKAKRRINNPKPEPKELVLKWLFVFTPFILSLLFIFAVIGRVRLDTMAQYIMHCLENTRWTAT